MQPPNVADEQYRPTPMPPEGSKKSVQKGTQPGHSAAGTLAHLHCVAAVRKISNRVTRVSSVLSLICKPSCARDATSNNPYVLFHHQWCISSHSSTFSFNIRDQPFIFRIVFSRMPTAWSHPQHGLDYYLLSARTPEENIPPTLPIYKPLGDMCL